MMLPSPPPTQPPAAQEIFQGLQSSGEKMESPGKEKPDICQFTKSGVLATPHAALLAL